MSVLKKLAGETVLYGMSSIVGRMLNFLLVPLYTAVLPAADYGFQSELYVYVAFLNVLYAYGMETTFFRYAAKAENDPQEVYNTALSYILVTSTIFSALLIVCAQPIARSLGHPESSHLIVWLAIIIAVDAVLIIPYARLRLENKAKQFAVTKLINIFVNIGCNLFFLYFCKNIYEGKFLTQYQALVARVYNPDMGIGYIILSNLVANALVLLLLYRSFLRFRFRLNWAQFRPMFIYSYPLMFMGIAGIASQLLDTIMLKYYLPEGYYYGKSNEAVVGIYRACGKLAIFMNLGIQAFKYAADPFFFSRAEDKKAPELFARVMKYFIITGAVFMVGIGLNLDIIVLLLRKPVYREAIGAVPFMLLGYLFLGVYTNLSIWFKLTDKTFYGTWLVTGGALLSLLLNYLLIPVMGYMGSAVALLVVYMGMTVASYLIGQKHFYVPYQVKSALVHVGLAAVLVFGVQFVNLGSALMNFLLHQGLFAGYLVLLVAIEWQDIKALIARLKNRKRPK
ncbi:oligosaccharide flippase family protein [uncultured Microscilla sp.]|uniref:lipopolysaccharide biosynthesis protein n=1 Tax=uncultured Microscilla sp. TaxID=432653 RepID=UPI00262D8D60|nr:oligosaccharide flippase family protein [uncultured Microscilla sp.]